jgi:hypothetical protein
MLLQAQNDKNREQEITNDNKREIQDERETKDEERASLASKT